MSANFTAGLAWRFGFLETAFIALALGIAIVVVRIPAAGAPKLRTNALAMLANRRVLTTGLMIFFSVATDLGFVYWLSEYFKTELGVSLRLASSVTGVYLLGIISGRLLMPLALKRLRPETLLPASLALALGGILAFILVPGPGAKAALCAVYGLGVGPVFPLLMSRGTREFPEQSGAVSGILYAGIALPRAPPRFVYWLSEYFKTELGVSLRLASSVTGVYLLGIISGRLLMPLALKRLRPETLLPASLALALGGILAFILVPGPRAKAALCAVYGLGVGPVFPLLMSRGTREFPEQSGAVSGILYAGIALGGMVFPLLVGAIAEMAGIAGSYWFCAAAAAGLLIGALVMRAPSNAALQRNRRKGPWPHQGGRRPIRRRAW